MDGRLARGERTRTAVLDEAVALASEVGLDGLSLAQLAERLGVSKSGLFAHWRSKEELQLAAVAHARNQWAERIVHPALAHPRGVRRLFAVHESRLEFYARRTLPGGCFFANAEFEYTGRAPEGEVRTALVAALTEWTTLLERLVTEAVEQGELPATVEPRLLAFEIDSAGVAGLLHSRLIGRDLDDSRRAVLNRLRDLTTDPTLLPDR
ncbi:AcrR family transcriptional regulator [Allocatelliglobosispora scoriae]|uniref:AcrR family transcriptional regulator n=1 Tax=Allocatelliglobosispora scoriae TaxID=643052 RepID=A0A841BUP7_9ACTN|nr:TetR/AcrR family transcriptional regulator [Allocatelliglobosispora scoriae]MBB5871176.1 AcrR family transcriptional regulator [Allocatelliglobosispora scoriae]